MLYNTEEGKKEDMKTEIESQHEEKNETVAEGDLTQDELKQLYDQSFVELEEDNIVKGKIVKISEKDVLIDIGYKSEGILPIVEFRNNEDLHVGQEIEVYLESKEDENGMVVLSKEKADKILGWERTIISCEEGKIVEGKIIKKVKGGLIVDIGMDAFLPASQVDVKPLRDLNLDDYIGVKDSFKVININRERKNIVLSRRELLEEEKKLEREKMLKEIEVGQIRKGFVKNITDFGVFIDLNGVDGLLHITDMTWGRISHPSELVAIGDAIEVIILDFDKEKQRVSLGLKQKTKNPWEDVDTKYPIGDRVKGRVVNIMPYGGFIELEKGIEGLIHISELSWTKRITHPSEILQVGDIVEAVVLDLDKENKKLSLGLKQTEYNPWESALEKYKEGSIVKGKVRNLTNYGAFVELEEGVDGLIHISDFSWTKKISNPEEMLKKGDEVEAVVLSVDVEGKKIALGKKQLTEDPWETIEKSYREGDIITGKVTKITGFGVFIEMADGIEGLIHVSQLSEKAVKRIDKMFEIGELIPAMVIKIDIDDRKISLSFKDVPQDEKKKWKAEAKEPDSNDQEQESTDAGSQETAELTPPLENEPLNNVDNNSDNELSKNDEQDS
ncbi:30S ribosomal protein S1 [Chlamydiota bacterium]